MSRRGQGGALVLAVVMVVIIGLLVGTPRVPGQAVAQPPPGPPGTGTCAGPVSGGHQLLRSGAVSYDAVSAQPCAARHAAEVAGVITEPTALGGCAADSAGCVDTVYGAVPVADPNQPDCDDLARGYAGLPAADATVGPWTTDAAVIGVLAGPSPRQTAAGQHWLACLIQDSAKTSDGRPLFTRSVRGAFAGYPVPPDLTACGTPDPLPTPCDVQHQVEIFGSTESNVDMSELESSCATLVSRRTQIPDLAAAGLRADAVGADESPTRYCVTVVLSPSRWLDGSLLNVGSRPLPWMTT